MAFNFIYFLNGLSTLGVAILSFYVFFLWLKNRNICGIGKLIGVNGLVFLLPSFLNLAWAFNLILPHRNDFILIDGCFSIIKSTILLLIVYLLVNNKHLLYFLFLFFLSSVAVLYSANVFFLFVSTISYLVVLIVSMDLVLFSNYYLKRAGYFGILYSFTSLIPLGFVLFGGEPSVMVWFIPNMALFFMLLSFYFDVKNCGVTVRMKRCSRYRIFLPLLFFKFFIFIMSMSSFIFLSTIAIHELGHSLAAQYYGCQKSKSIIYDLSDRPHTEMVCEGYYNDTVISLAGIILTLVVSFVFLFTGGEFTTIVSYIIFGFSLLIGYGDLIGLGVSVSIVFTIMFVALIFLIAGVVRLSTYYIRHQKSFYKSRLEMEGVSPDKYLWLDDDTPIRNLYELIEALHKMGRVEFRRYVTEDKNVFRDWVRDSLGEKELAKQISNVKEKKLMESLVLMYLLKKQAERKTILRFICFPLLKNKIRVQK